MTDQETANPKFEAFKAALKDKVSGAVQDEYDRVKDELSAAKTDWLQSKILYEEIQDLALGLDCDDGNAKGGQYLDDGNREASEILLTSLSFSQLEHHVAEEKSSECSTVFGVDKDDLRRLNPYKNKVRELQNIYFPLLEERLQKKCETLLEFYSPEQSSNSDLKLAQCNQLPALIDADINQLKDMRQGLLQDKRHYLAQLSSTHQVMSNGLKDLEMLLKSQRIGEQIDYRMVKAQWLIAKCDLLALKLSVLELETLSETYNADTIAALKPIKLELDKAMESSRTMHHNTVQSLEAYESIGQDFNFLITEYCTLQHDLDNKKWALDTIKTSS